MTREELETLRREAAAFLTAVQNLDGFSQRRADLRPPGVGLSLPWWSIKRVLSLPSDEGPPPGTGVLIWEPGADEEGGPVTRQRARPSFDELEELEAYVKRVQSFAKDYLAGPEWGARAVHEALRSNTEVRLPRPAAEAHVRVSEGHSAGWVRPSELPSLARRHAPRPELRGNRDSTWKAAVACIDARLQCRPAMRRDALQRARTYLNAAVNRGFSGDPVEPSDDPRYEARARARIERNLKQRNPAEDPET